MEKDIIILLRIYFKDSEFFLLFLVFTGCYLYFTIYNTFTDASCNNAKCVISYLDYTILNCIIIVFISIKKYRNNGNLSCFSLFCRIKAKLLFSIIVCGILLLICLPILVYNGYSWYYMLTFYLYSIGFFNTFAIPVMILAEGKSEELNYIRYFGYTKYVILCVLYAIIPVVMLIVLEILLNDNYSSIAIIPFVFLGIIFLSCQKLAIAFFVKQFVL